MASYVPQLELKWVSRVGPILMIRYKEKGIGLAFCHRMEDRCIKLLGYQTPLCARCSGVFIGIILALLLISSDIMIPMFLGFALIFPLVADGASQLLNLYESNNSVRLITGILFAPAFLSLLTG